VKPIRIFKLILPSLIIGLLSCRAIAESLSRRDWPKPVADSENYNLLLIDILEARQDNSAIWDVIGWHGTDTHRLWIKSEGTKQKKPSDSSDADFQLLYGKLISPYYDAQVGVRAQQHSGQSNDSSRYFGVLGIQGLAPYYFELDANLFLSQAGELSARVTGSQDFLVTQRLISQLRIETNLAAKRSEQYEVGAGINDLEIGLRFRYEFWREFAPYLGLSWNQAFGESADFLRVSGRNPSQTEATGGVRMLF
jgi:copper resistance protein B